MRITNNMLSGNYLMNLNKNLRVMQKAQNQLSSGKEVSRPSDNPMLVSRIMQMESTVKMNQQYTRNIDDSLGWADTADGALNIVTSTLQRVRELISYGGNGILSDTDRLAIKDGVEGIKGQLLQVLNTNYDGRYIFGGLKTTEPPFELDSESNKLVYKGFIPEEGSDTGRFGIDREIARGVTVSIPANGNTIITAQGASDGNSDLGEFINNVIGALDGSTGSSTEMSSKHLKNIDAHLDNVIKIRSKMGSVYNRLESAKERNTAENNSMAELLSKSADIDLAEKIMEFSTLNMVYQASLQTGGKILQSSLLDYIR